MSIYFPVFINKNSPITQFRGYFKVKTYYLLN
nr:MAG TPA: hypothetical protein [Caudoviricetes sp.]